MPYTDYLPNSSITFDEHEKRHSANVVACVVLEINAFKQVTGNPSTVEETPKTADSLVDLTKGSRSSPNSVEPRRHRVSINYTTFPKVLHPSISNERPFFHFHVNGFNAKTPNFDRLGVLYELRGMYFTICECKNDSGHESTTIRHQWLCAGSVGRYIRDEWAVLPKEKAGDFGMGVAGEWATGVHSHRMMQARKLCLDEAQKLEKDGINVQKTPCPAAAFQVFQDTLTKELSRVLNRFFSATGELEKQQEEAMNLFINFDMTEG